MHTGAAIVSAMRLRRFTIEMEIEGRTSDLAPDLLVEAHDETEAIARAREHLSRKHPILTDADIGAAVKQ